MNMWFVVLMIAFASAKSRAQNSTTYLHIDQSTGQTLTCSRCEPGYRLLDHCTATQPTKCMQCQNGLYTECWNYVPDCLICDTCYENQVISQPCSPFQNTKCACKEGYFWNTYYCKRHKMCPSGHGVKTKGTSYEDTECVLCPSGSYAVGKLGHATCEVHTKCELKGCKTILKGTIWHDNICVCCDSIHEDGVEYLRSILPDFFIHNNLIKNKRLARMFQKSNKRFHIKRNSRPEMNDPLVHITAWVSKASVQDLRKLPEMLEKVHLYHAAEKLDSKITRLDKEVKTCIGSKTNTIDMH
ncbi:tumor necrosis factor receptor superfamily member 11B-like [Alosa pseudoharengus]|uniref:tumor necrosis factor receptor superfamily member 11B-like n=1 Tax=Alosa pseudoharengus TaxID=34774 RepID=UPI003F8A1DB7